MDKVRASAAQGAQKAQEAAKAGQAKVEQVQAKRELDSMLHDLGAALYAQHSGRDSGEPSADVERLLASITTHEAQHGPIDLVSTAGTTAATTVGDRTIDDES